MGQAVTADARAIALATCRPGAPYVVSRSDVIFEISAANAASTPHLPPYVNATISQTTSMSARNRPRLSLDVLLVGVILVIALLLVYQGIAMVMSRYGPGELAAGTPGSAAAAEQDSVRVCAFG